MVAIARYDTARPLRRRDGACMIPPPVDITRPGSHGLWCAESPTGQRVTCSLTIDGALPMRLRYDGAVAGTRERRCWAFVEALVASDQSLAALVALGWRRCTDEPGVPVQPRLKGMAS